MLPRRIQHVDAPCAPVSCKARPQILHFHPHRIFLDERFLGRFTYLLTGGAVYSFGKVRKSFEVLIADLIHKIRYYRCWVLLYTGGASFERELFGEIYNRQSEASFVKAALLK